MSLPPRQRGARGEVAHPLRMPLLLGGGLALLGAIAGWLALRTPAAANPPPLPAAIEGPPRATRLASAVIPPPRLIEPFRDRMTDSPAEEEPPPAGDRGGLTRADVLNGMEALREAIDRCPREPARIGVVKMTVAASGRVTGVQLAGGLAGTSAGECVASVARGAVFRPNPREQTVISWPLAIGRPSPSSGASRDVPESDPPGADPEALSR